MLTLSPIRHWRDGYEESNIYDEDTADREERGWVNRAAKLVYDALIHLGGRPSRPIRSQPIWEFSDSIKRTFVKNDWVSEFQQFATELLDWQEFLLYQQNVREHEQSIAREARTNTQSYSQDDLLSESHMKLNNWREYRVWHLDAILALEDQAEYWWRAEEGLQGKNTWAMFCHCKESIHIVKSRLEWIEGQLPLVLAECATSLSMTPISRRRMEESCEADVRQVYQTLIKMNGRSNRSIQTVPDAWYPDQTNEHLHVLRHWEDEYRQFEEELRQWKEFLNHRQKSEMDGLQSADGLSNYNLWKEYENFQQSKVDNQKHWVEDWHRKKNCRLRDYHASVQLATNTLQEKADGRIQPARYNTILQEAKLYVCCALDGVDECQARKEEAQEQVEVAETRLIWMKQQLPAIFAECTVSAANLSTPDHLVDPDSLSEAASETVIKSQLARSSKSTTRGNPRVSKSNKRPTGDAALGRVHFQSRRQPFAPARSDTTKRLSSPVKVPSRRSSRLCDLQKKSVSVKSDLAADSGNGSRRGNEKPDVDSTDIKPSSSFKRVLKSKSRRHNEGNRLDSSSAKPVGISKRRYNRKRKLEVKGVIAVCARKPTLSRHSSALAPGTTVNV